MSVFEVIVRTNKGTITLSRVGSDADSPAKAIRQIRNEVTDQLHERGKIEWFYITHVEQVSDIVESDEDETGRRPSTPVAHTDSASGAV